MRTKRTRRAQAAPADGWAPRLKFPRVSESQVQAAVVRHCRVRGIDGLVCVHIPNGGSRSKAEAGRFRAEGVVAGVPDLLLVAPPRAGEAGVRTFWLELKADKGRLSDAQKHMIARLERCGATVAVAYGLDEALARLEAWELLK